MSVGTLHNDPGRPAGGHPATRESGLALSLSAVLLDLYRYSHELTLAEFPGRVLARLQEDLPFDSAWWGVAQTNKLINSSFPYRLPADYAQFYRNGVSDTDTLAQAAMAAPARTINFSPALFASSPGLSLLTRSFGIQQALCTVLFTPTLNLVMFTSLYRHSLTPYTEAERSFCELVAPHLWATWTANWIAQLEHERANVSESRVAHAVADQGGVLHSAEPRFVELLHNERAQWRGPALPDDLWRALDTQGHYRGRSLDLNCFRANGLTLLTARVRSPLDLLSARERTIAAAFGEGQSYKRIAFNLGLAPATVRHYVRSIYTKANVSNKAELAHLLSASRDRAP